MNELMVHFRFDAFLHNKATEILKNDGKGRGSHTLRWWRGDERGKTLMAQRIAHCAIPGLCVPYVYISVNYMSFKEHI